MENIPTHKDRKKLNLAVKKEFQRWMLKHVLLAVTLSALIAAVTLYFYARQEVVGSFFDAHVKIRRVSDLLLPVIISGSGVSLLVGVALALFLPQKIAGPIYRIEEGLKKIGDGDLTTIIKLRDDDALQDLAETANQATSALRDLLHDAKTVGADLEQAVLDGKAEKSSELIARQNEIIAKLMT